MNADGQDKQASYGGYLDRVTRRYRETAVRLQRAERTIIVTEVALDEAYRRIGGPDVALPRALWGSNMRPSDEPHGPAYAAPPREG